MAKRGQHSYKVPFLHRRWARLILLILVLAGGSVLAYAQLRGDKPKDIESSSSQDSYVNLNPPTEQERQATDEHKRDLANQPAPTPPSNGGKKSVTPVITSSTKSEVYAYVPGVFEENGICKATATLGNLTETAASEGFGNVNYTSCAPMKFTPALGSGTWSIVVSYSSATSEGKSNVYKVE